MRSVKQLCWGVGLLLFTAVGSVGQEKLLPVYYNPLLNPATTQQLDHSPRKTGALSLPFRDDFSAQGPYPDPQKWTDSFAFVNRSYAIRPPTIGVATLDGLDENGQAYREGNLTDGPADTLTSRPIDLSSFNINDSIFLSFYYQPEGRGDNPDDQDSLIVEFLPSTDTVWRRKWGISGRKMHEFRQKLIQIKNPVFFHSDFRFRFRNYASISGNNDHWHIDYVRVGKNRHAADTVVNDVAITSVPITLLDRYTIMPWSQFLADSAVELKSQHGFAARNNFSSVKSTDYHYTAIDRTTGKGLDTSVVATTNLEAHSNDSFRFPLFGLPGYSSDSVTIRTTYTVNATGDVNRENDTIYFDQHFRKLLAYDDGSAEAAYGVFSAGARVAQKYELNKSATLYGVSLHFSHMNKDVSDRIFYLTVWRSITEGGSGQDKMFQERIASKPQYTDEINGFHYYSLDTGLELSEGTYYVGWEQTYQDILRVGYDRNTRSQQNLFYNVDGTWQNTKFEGSLMMRPVFDKSLLASQLPRARQSSDNVKIYPNPARQRIFIQPRQEEWSRFRLLDIQGRVVKSGLLVDHSLKVRSLPEGVYILQLSGDTGQPSVQKKVIVR